MFDACRNRLEEYAYENEEIQNKYDFVEEKLAEFVQCALYKLQLDYMEKFFIVKLLNFCIHDR